MQKKLLHTVSIWHCVRSIHFRDNTVSVVRLSSIESVIHVHQCVLFAYIHHNDFTVQYLSEPAKTFEEGSKWEYIKPRAAVVIQVQLWNWKHFADSQVEEELFNCAYRGQVKVLADLPPSEAKWYCSSSTRDSTSMLQKRGFCVGIFRDILNHNILVQQIKTQDWDLLSPENWYQATTKFNRCFMMLL